jgi:predicted nucleic acid-binding protein
MRAVIDTSVASILLSGGVLEQFYSERTRDVELVISFQTAEEMVYGAHSRSWGERRLKALQDHLLRYPIIGGEWDLALVCARIRVDAERLGRQLKTADAWIVATAVHLAIPLITADSDQVIPDIAGYSYVSHHGVGP